MISNDYFIEFNELEKQHGHENALSLFKRLKEKRPEVVISPAFADQIISGLPIGLASFKKAEWGLESEDSDSCIYWCEHYYLNIPSINAEAFIEVGDNHYFVNLIVDGEYFFDGENLSSCSHIPDAIFDMVTQFSSISK